jgi:demethylmenaquinone methyltransferase/2-methoxy-6-polyprenyl-1,4-benzoquinol methylase
MTESREQNTQPVDTTEPTSAATPTSAQPEAAPTISPQPASMFQQGALPTGTPQGQQQAAQGQASDTTHFGYKTVRTDEKQQKVAEVFHSVAAKYDLMNDLMSFGIHRLWKRFAITLSGVRRGQKVLDIAGGTGDLAKVFSREVGPSGRVVLSDINESMLAVGRDRLIDAGCTNVDFILANAETLEPFADESFDLLTISFGLRNVTDKDAALRSMYRVLKPGGRLLILEFSKPIFEPLSKLYDLYSFTALPVMGKLVAGDSESYRYLAESIRMHPDQRTLRQMMENAGFQSCDYHNLTGGIVALHRGFK